MKLASLKEGGRDGTLVVVDRDLERAVRVRDIAPSLQRAIEDWPEAGTALASVYRQLNRGDVAGAFDLDATLLTAPLPRTYQFLDGSAYLNHVELARRARGETLPETLETDPLMYQGCSDFFLGPRDPIRVGSEAWGADFEAELAVVIDDVPSGVSPTRAGAHIKLFMLLNDVSLRRLIPAELAKGFGFVHGKPPSAFSPVAVTPDELGTAWDGARLHLPLISTLNERKVGDPDAGVEMQFGFPELIAHAAKTRPLGAGAIIGSGTVSNSDRSRGSSCLLEQRMIEKIDTGEVTTEFMRFGDRIRIEMLDEDGRSIFGAIDQEVVEDRGGQ